MVVGPKKLLRVVPVRPFITRIRLVAAALLLVPLLAHAAGLGRLTILSALGQPLNAEIEVVALQPGEDEGIGARLAPPEAFRQAGIELNPALVGVQFAVERRDGRALIRMRTTQPVNEPFLDVLVELQWASGRLVREYTLLLDPPEYKAPAPVVAAAPPAPAAAPLPERAPSIETRPISPARAAPAAPAAPARAAGTYEVKKGDTLGEIALANRPAGVSFNQMLIALYRANEPAFIRNNINLVRAGRILNIPDREAAAGIDAAEVSRLVKEHHAEFAQYRQQLAAAVAARPPSAAPAAREVTGRIGRRATSCGCRAPSPPSPAHPPRAPPARTTA